LGKSGLEALSDGVIAGIVTIMVLEFKMRYGGDLSALYPLLPAVIRDVPSFVVIGMCRNGHLHRRLLPDRRIERVLHE